MDYGVFVLALWIYNVLAKLETALPINNQVPPVARASQPYSYQFAPNTYTSTLRSDLSYNISNAPSWLQLDSVPHTLLGTPSIQDVGPFTFLLSATDGQGSVTSQVSLIVVNDLAPTVTGNLSATLAAAGPLSGPSTLALGPGTSFEITVGRDYFHSNGQLFHYATSADRTPLPSWIGFDATAIAFTGATPQPATAPREYGISLFASQVAGFAEASLTFAILVVNHKLLFDSVSYNLTFYSMANVSIDSSQYLKLDGQPVPSYLIASAQANGPAWLALDPKTLMLTGSAPEGTSSEKVVVSVIDVFGDEASVIVLLSFVSSTATSASYVEMETTTMITGIATSAPVSVTSGHSLQSHAPGGGSTATSTIIAAADQGHRGSRRLSRGELAATIVLPILLLVAISSCCACLVMRAKRRRQQSREEFEDSLFGPMPSTHQEQQRRGFRSSRATPIGLGIGAMHDNAPGQTHQETSGHENTESGHTLASTTQSASASHDYNSVIASLATDRNERHESAYGASSRPDAERQIPSTIRKVSQKASNEYMASVTKRPFNEMRQSFIGRRASNPNRPLFSAGTGAIAVRNVSMPEREVSGRLRNEAGSAGTTRGEKHQDAFQEGFPRATSIRSPSSEWRDFEDDESRYTLEENEDSLLDGGESENESGRVEPLRIRKWPPVTSPTATVAGTSQGVGSSAFIEAVSSEASNE